MQNSAELKDQHIQAEGVFLGVIIIVIHLECAPVIYRSTSPSESENRNETTLWYVLYILSVSNRAPPLK